MLFICKRTKALLLLIVSFIFFTTSSFAAVVTVGDGATVLISVENPSAGDTVSYTAGNGTLEIDASDWSLSDVKNAASGTGGIVNFTADQTLTLTGEIGDTTNGTLGGITTGTAGEGSVIIGGTAAQTIYSSLGSASAALKSITTNNSSGATFTENFYTQALTVTESSTILATSSGAVGNVGDLTIASGKTLTMGGNNLTLTITGDVGSTGGAIHGDSATTDNGIIVLSGTTAQAITADLGISDATRINSLTIDNSTGVTISNGNLFVNSFAVNQDTSLTTTTATDIASADIADGATLNLNSDATIAAVATNSSGAINLVTDSTITTSGDISGTGSITTTTGGQGSLTLNGTSTQTIAAELGSSTASLKGIAISNTSATNFTNNLYVTNGLTATSAEAIGFTGTSAQTVSSAIGTTGTRFGVLTISNTAGVTLKDDVFVGSLVLSGAASLDSSKTITTSGSISGDGTLSGSGNLTLDSTTTAQTVAANIGNSASDKFGDVTVTATGGTSFSQNIYANSIIGTGKDITFDGTSAQTINATLGGSGTELNSITVSNSAGSTFNQDIHADAFTNSAGTTSISGSTMNLGALAVSGGTLYVAGDAATTGLTASSTGTVSIASGKTLTTTGTATVAAGNTLNFETESSGVGKMVSTGTTTITDGATVNIDYSNTTSSPLVTAQTIIQDGGTDFSTVTLNVTDNSFLLSSSLSQGTGSITVTSAVDSAAVSSLDEYSASVTDAALGISSSTGTMAQAQNQLLVLENAEEVEDAADSLSGPRNNMSEMTAFAISDQVLSALSVKGAPDPLDENKAKPTGEIWGETFASRAIQGRKSGIDGYTSSTGGLVFGYDDTFKSGKTKRVFGAAAAYGHGFSNQTSPGQRVNIDSFQAAIYNNNFNADGLGFFSKHAIHGSFDKYSTRRRIIIGSLDVEAKGGFSGHQYGMQNTFGYGVKISDNFAISPHAGLHASSLAQASHTETKAGTVGLVNSRKTISRMISEVGAEFAINYFNQEYLIPFKPRLDLSWMRNLKPGGVESTSQFIAGGDSFTSTAPDLPENLLNADLRMSFPLFGLDSSVELRYNLKTGSGYFSNAGYANYRYNF